MWLVRTVAEKESVITGGRFQRIGANASSALAVVARGVAFVTDGASSRLPKARCGVTLWDAIRK